MFSELTKLRELRRLLKRRAYAEVLLRAKDPEICDHRRALVAAEKARAALLKLAGEQEGCGDLTQALCSVRTVLQNGAGPEAVAFEERLVRGIRAQEVQASVLEEEVRRAGALADDGDVGAALARLDSLSPDHDGAREAARRLRQRERGRQQARRDLEQALREAPLPTVEEALRLLKDAGPDEASLVIHWLGGVGRSEDGDAMASALIGTRSLVGKGESALAEARESVGRRLLQLVEQRVTEGKHRAAARWLAAWPIGPSVDGRGAALIRGIESLEEAQRVYASGDHVLARKLLAEVTSVLPRSPLTDRLQEDLERDHEEAAPPLESARGAFREGRLIAARGTLVALLGAQPGNREAKDLFAALEHRERGDLDALKTARSQLRSGTLEGLEEARRVLAGLEVSRPDLQEVPVLLQDALRWVRELRSPEAMDHDRGDERLEPVPDEADSPGARPIVFRHARDLDSGGSLRGGQPFILRVEERGDWLVHPGDSVTLGSSAGGTADLQVLASIGSRHLRFERFGSEDDVRYRVVVQGRRELALNGQAVRRSAVLEHGDALVVGGVLRIKFTRSVPASGTAVLSFGNSSTVRGCRRVLLFAEIGRRGSIVVGPRPEAHVPLPPDGDRVEVLRAVDGEHRGALLARSPSGVASGEGVDRPQVLIKPGVALRAGPLTMFADPV